MLLNDTGKRTGAHLLIVALLGQPIRRFGGQFDIDLALRQLGLELHDELLHHLAHHPRGQVAEGDHRVEAVTELRREHALDGGRVVALTDAAAKSDRLAGHVLGARIGGHDQDDVTEIDRLAVVVRQLAVIHDLQENVEQVRVRLLDLVQQQHRIWVLVDAIGQ